MTPVSSLPVVLNGKVILHCKHIKVWNPTQPSPARPAAVSLSLPRGPQIAFAATAQAELSQITPSAACVSATRDQTTRSITHTDVTGLRHEPHTHRWMRANSRLLMATVLLMLSRREKGNPTPTTRGVTSGGISTVFCGMLASSVFWKNANQRSLETPYIWHL